MFKIIDDTDIGKTRRSIFAAGLLSVSVYRFQIKLTSPDLFGITGSTDAEIGTSWIVTGLFAANVYLFIRYLLNVKAEKSSFNEALATNIEDAEKLLSGSNDLNENLKKFDGDKRSLLRLHKDISNQIEQLKPIIAPLCTAIIDTERLRITDTNLRPYLDAESQLAITTDKLESLISEVLDNLDFAKTEFQNVVASHLGLLSKSKEMAIKQIEEKDGSTLWVIDGLKRAQSAFKNAPPLSKQAAELKKNIHILKTEIGDEPSSFSKIQSHVFDMHDIATESGVILRAAASSVQEFVEISNSWNASAAKQSIDATIAKSKKEKNSQDIYRFDRYWLSLLPPSIGFLLSLYAILMQFEFI